VVAAVVAFLRQAVETAVEAGIDARRVIVDPGIGFGKTFAHNLQLLHHLNDLHRLHCPILVGASRKVFIRHFLKPSGEKDIQADLPIVATGTQACVAASALQGAHIVRVHDVAETCATLKIIDAIRNAGDGLSAEGQGAE
jgi:dihydropteroate synthase